MVLFAACLAMLAVVSASPLKKLDQRDGCNQDNCYRALDGFQRTSEASFCSEYFHTSTKTAPAAIATIESCGPSNISSGCSCLMTATASVSALPPSKNPTTPSDKSHATAVVTTSVTIPGAGETTTITVPENPVTITLKPPIETHTVTLSVDAATAQAKTETITLPATTVASTVTATANPDSAETTPTSTPSPICPLADKTTIAISSNDTRGGQPPGALSLYSIHCHTDYNPGYVLFASAATGLQQCAQQCTDYTCQHDTECTAATYSFGQCYGRSGSLKEKAIEYTDAVLLSTAIVTNSSGDQ